MTSVQEAGNRNRTEESTKALQERKK